MKQVLICMYATKILSPKHKNKMKQIVLLIMVFLGLFISPKHSKAQDITTTIIKKASKFEAKQLIVGIDVGVLAVAKLRAVPLTLRYATSDRTVAVLSWGYVNFHSDSVAKSGTNYKSGGFYISTGVDHIFTWNKGTEGIWCGGVSIIFSRTSESMNYTFKGNSFADYVGKINRDMNIIGLEARMGYLHVITTKIQVYTGFRCVFAEANKDNFRSLPVRYIPGIGYNALRNTNIIPTFELKLYYKLF
jgi:hypothetical protein